MRSGVISVERFEHNGASLIDEVIGETTSRHLVFLHGWGASRDSLRGIAILFERTHSVHLIDLPGFDAHRFPQWSRDARATWSTAVPTIHQSLLARLEAEPTWLDDTRFRFLRSSSAALPAPVLSDAAWSGFPCGLGVM